MPKWRTLIQITSISPARLTPPTAPLGPDLDANEPYLSVAFQHLLHLFLEPSLPLTSHLKSHPCLFALSSVPYSYSCTPLQPLVAFKWAVVVQSICPNATCFLSKQCKRLWDLQTVFDHRDFAALALVCVATDWSVGIAVASGTLPWLGPHTNRRPLDSWWTRKGPGMKRS